MFGRERAGELNLPLDPVDLSHLGLALGAIDRVNLRVVQRHGYALEWPAFGARVERDRHRRARAKRGQEKIVWRRSGVCPTKRDRFVAFETVRTDLNFLRKSRGTAADDYVRRTVSNIGCHGYSWNGPVGHEHVNAVSTITVACTSCKL